MANPLAHEKELYQRILHEGITIERTIWNFIYLRINEDVVAIILTCQHWLQAKEAMPIQEARKILVCTKDTKSTLDAIIRASKESLIFPQFQDSLPLNPLVQELIAHQIGNDIYAIDLIVNDTICNSESKTVPLEIVQKVLTHALAIKEFMERLRTATVDHSTDGALQIADSQYHGFYDSLKDGLFMTDMNGVFWDANRTFLDMLGLSRDELVRFTHRQVTPQKWHEKEEEILKEEILVKGYSHLYEKEYLRKDGTVFAVSLQVWLIRNAQNVPVGLWGIAQDIAEHKLAENALLKNLFDFHVVIDNVNDGITVSDDQGHFEIFNRRMQEITGFAKEEANNQKDFHTLILPDPLEQQRAMDRLRDIETRGAGQECEVVIRAKDRTLKTIWVATSLITYKDRPMFLSVFRDISERKHFEELVEQERDRAQNYLDVAGVILVIINVDTKVSMINKKGCELLGYPREEILGQSWFEKFIPSEQRGELETVFQKLISGEIAPTEYYENPVLAKDGTIRMIAWHNIVLKDKQGAVTSTLSSGEDITERSRLLHALQVSEKRFHRLFEAAPDGIAVLNINSGEVVDVNNQLVSMLGYSRQELIGRKIWEIETFQDIPAIKMAFLELQVKGYSWYGDMPLVTKSGRRIDVEFVSNVYRVDDENVVQCNIRDISERVSSEKEREALAGEVLRTNRKLEELTLKDSHTGLYNHRYLKEALETKLAIAQRQGSPLSVTMIDLDYFKSINDVYGHLFGDRVLKQFAQQLKSVVRPYDVLIRYGGEEFIILSQDTSRMSALTLARRILHAVNLFSFGDNKNTVKLKISLAVASYPEDPILKPIDLVEQADALLNIAKESGGNRVCSSLDVGKSPEMVSDDVVNLKSKLSKLTKRANQSLVEAIFAFAKTIELKDSYTGEHVEKTVHYASQIARELGLTADKISAVEKAAMLHDLGKIGVSERILHKKSRLNSREMAVIKRHPQIGADILRPIHPLQPIIPLILYHHERWDGRGYPAGLKENHIPMGARIIAIADVFQALTSDRPYHKAFSDEVAIKMIKKSSGSQFDPTVVNSFLRVIASQKEPAFHLPHE